MIDHPSNPPSQEPTFPIQCKRGAKAHPLRVPWAIAELAYSVYAGENGTQQSLADLAARGGFGPSEMDVFLPDWREQCSALAAQEARYKTAEKLCLAIIDAQASLILRLRTQLKEAESKLRVSHVQNAFLQREVGLLEETISEQASKLREATAREKTLVELIEDAVWGARAAGLTEYSNLLEGKLAAFRSGPAQQATETFHPACRVCRKELAPVTLRGERRHTCEDCRKLYRAPEQETRGKALDAAVEKFLKDGCFTAPWDTKKWAALCKALNGALCDYRGVP